MPVGDIAWTWVWSGGSMCWAMYRWNALHLNDPTSYAPSFFCLPGYTRNQTDRLEWRLERDTPTSAKVQLRAYDASGTLIADNDVFRNSLGTLNQRIATAGVKVEGMTTATKVAEDLQSLDAGQSGQSNTNWTPGNYVYFGAFAVRVSGDPNGWIGPYRLTAQER